MTDLINSTRSALSNTVLFVTAVVMAGLSFAFVGTLALFALLTVGVAMIAAPIVSGLQPSTPDV